MTSSKRGFAQSMKQDPQLETGETSTQFKNRILGVVREVVDFGLYVEDGELHYHDNVDRVHRAVKTMSGNDVEVLHHSNDSVLKRAGMLISEWGISGRPAKNQTMEESRADGLVRMKCTLELLRDAGYDKMPMVKDACGRRIGDNATGVSAQVSLAGKGLAL